MKPSFARNTPLDAVLLVDLMTCVQPAIPDKSIQMAAIVCVMTAVIMCLLVLAAIVAVMTVMNVALAHCKLTC